MNRFKILSIKVTYPKSRHPKKTVCVIKARYLCGRKIYSINTVGSTICDPGDIWNTEYGKNRAEIRAAKKLDARIDKMLHNWSMTNTKQFGGIVPPEDFKFPYHKVPYIMGIDPALLNAERTAISLVKEICKEWKPKHERKEDSPIIQPGDELTIQDGPWTLKCKVHSASRKYGIKL